MKQIRQGKQRVAVVERSNRGNEIDLLESIYGDFC